MNPQQFDVETEESISKRTRSKLKIEESPINVVNDQVEFLTNDKMLGQDTPKEEKNFKEEYEEAIKLKERAEAKIEGLETEICVLKRTKVLLSNQLTKEKENYRTSQTGYEKELTKLRELNKKQANLIKKKEQEFELAQTVLKRKVETIKKKMEKMTLQSSNEVSELRAKLKEKMKENNNLKGSLKKLKEKKKLSKENINPVAPTNKSVLKSLSSAENRKQKPLKGKLSSVKLEESRFQVKTDDDSSFTISKDFSTMTEEELNNTFIISKDLSLMSSDDGLPEAAPGPSGL